MVKPGAQGENFHLPFPQFNMNLYLLFKNLLRTYRIFWAEILDLSDTEIWDGKECNIDSAS